MVMKKISNSADVLAAIEKYLKRHGESATRFGLRFNNDPNLVHNLRAGRGPRMTTIDRLIPFLEEPPPTSAKFANPNKLEALLKRSERLHQRLLSTQEKATKA